MIGPVLDEDLEALAACTALEDLYFGWEDGEVRYGDGPDWAREVQECPVAAISPLAQLKYLRIDDELFNDASLPLFANLPSLEDLTLTCYGGVH